MNIDSTDVRQRARKLGPPPLPILKADAEAAREYAAECCQEAEEASETAQDAERDSREYMPPARHAPEDAWSAMDLAEQRADEAARRAHQLEREAEEASWFAADAEGQYEAERLRCLGAVRRIVRLRLRGHVRRTRTRAPRRRVAASPAAKCTGDPDGDSDPEPPGDRSFALRAVAVELAAIGGAP